MTIHDTHRCETPMLRVELGYCPRCGTLRAVPAGAATNVCTACLKIFEWINSGWERPGRRRSRRVNASKGGRS